MSENLYIDMHQGISVGLFCLIFQTSPISQTISQGVMR